MGNKSSAIGLRLQINRTWDSRWFAEGQDYGRLLLEDLKIRKYIMKALPQAAISKVVIERPAKLCRISIYAARPGVIIGKKGSDIEKLKATIGKMTASAVSLNIVEIRKPEVDARLVAQGVAMKAMVSEIRDGRLEAGIVARFVALLVLALLLPARSTFAQVPAATPLRLTLQQAVTLGLKQAPEIAIANLTLAESQQARTAARVASTSESLGLICRARSDSARPRSYFCCTV